MIKVDNSEETKKGKRKKKEKRKLDPYFFLDSFDYLKMATYIWYRLTAEVIIVTRTRYARVIGSALGHPIDRIDADHWCRYQSSLPQATGLSLWPFSCVSCFLGKFYAMIDMFDSWKRESKKQTRYHTLIIMLVTECTIPQNMKWRSKSTPDGSGLQPLLLLSKCKHY